MDIRNVSINKLHPYDRNTRRNDDAVDAATKSNAKGLPKDDKKK